jgi:hypothetical protein
LQNVAWQSHVATNKTVGVSYEEVKVLRQFGAILLLLVSCVAPAMACMAPNAKMTNEERACCRMMKNDCGQMMDMPASHHCCKKSPQTLGEAALKTNTVTVHPLMFAVLVVASFDLLGPYDAITGWVQRPEHSPPKAPPSTITVLRI